MDTNFLISTSTCLSGQQTEIQQRHFRKLGYNSQTGIFGWMKSAHAPVLPFCHLWFNGVGKYRLQDLQTDEVPGIYLEENTRRVTNTMLMQENPQIR